MIRSRHSRYRDAHRILGHSSIEAIAKVTFIVAFISIYTFPLERASFIVINTIYRHDYYYYFA